MCWFSIYQLILRHYILQKEIALNQQINIEITRTVSKILFAENIVSNLSQNIAIEQFWYVKVAES